MANTVTKTDTSMSLTQKLYTLPKLLYLAIKPKPTPDNEKATGFSIQFSSCYINHKQLSRFNAMFNDSTETQQPLFSFAFNASFGAMLQTLLQAPIEAKLFGLIHLTANIRQHKAHNWLLPYDLNVTLSDISSTPKGTIYQIDCVFEQFGRKTLSCTNTMLDKDRHYQPNSRSNNETLPVPQLIEIAHWPVTQRLAWSYAQASGDYNPIHLHSRLAQLFGMRHSLMHGMYNLHKAIQQLNKNNKKLNSAKIEFNKPCWLPNDVVLATDDANSDQFVLVSNDHKLRFAVIELHLR